VRGADQSKMREGLREIAEMLAFGTELLGVKTDVICVTEHFFKNKSRHLRIAAAREAFGEPKRAHAESSLLARKSVGRGIAKTIPVDKRVFDEVFIDGVQR